MKNTTFILWVKYLSEKNGREYDRHIKIKALDIYKAREKAERILEKFSGEIQAEQLYYA